MSELQQRLVEEARSWAGTPFQHQGQLKGTGVDCAQFVALVAKGAGIEVEIPHDYRPREDGTVMLKLLNEHMEMVSTEDVGAGDVIAFCDEALREPDIPRHLAFVSEVTPKTIFIIHASEHGVRLHRTDSHWRKRIHSAWRLRE
jgi:cell wall-associated NlpC family hydrolase